jgi:hypothetical protein
MRPKASTASGWKRLSRPRPKLGRYWEKRFFQ